RKAHARAGGGTIDGGNDGTMQPAQPPQERMKADFQRGAGVALAGLVAALQIGAGAERASSPRQHEAAHLVSLVVDRIERLAETTGGNGGIGLGIAQPVNAQGGNVSIWGRNGEKNRSAAATMSAGPGKVDSRICDVSDPASVKAAMKATLDTFGRVDGCFANA